MEESIASIQNDDEEPLYDALDDFPFYDCTDSFSSDVNVDSPEHAEFSNENHKVPPPRTTLRRRRSLSQSSSNEIQSATDSATNPSSSSVSLYNYPKFLERKRKLSQKITENEKEIEKKSSNLDQIKLKIGSESLNDAINEEDKEVSAITIDNNEETSDSVEKVSSLRETEDSNSSTLLFLVNLLIKTIGFQINLLVYFVTFPVWLIYTSYMFVIDPFRIMRRGRSYVTGKVMTTWGFLSKSVSPVVYERLMEHNSVWKLGLKCGWGFLWSVYVGFVLLGLLVVAFVMGGLVIKGVVEEPIRIKEVLNFDYTEKSPAAYVPLLVCPRGDCGVEYKENEQLGKIGGGRVIPPNHKLQVTVSLELPESDYNRNLGIFQVRIDFLAADGRTLASSRRPCMLQFKSDPIRFLLTFLNVAPLITGYASESQILNTKFRGFTEGKTPTACLRAILEQRAEFQPGAGIPEIYTASLTLESELPLLKRIIWYWKRTLFVWISMTIFTMELLFVLLCCKPLVIPRIKLRGSSSSGNAPHDNRPVQR